MVINVILQDPDARPIPSTSCELSDRNTGKGLTGYSDGGGFMSLDEAPAGDVWNAMDLGVFVVNGFRVVASSKPHPSYPWAPYYFQPTSDPNQTVVLTIVPFV